MFLNDTTNIVHVLKTNVNVNGDVSECKLIHAYGSLRVKQTHATHSWEIDN